MEAVERIKDATFDINTIGLYDAELDRKWREEAKMAYAKKTWYRRRPRTRT